MIEEKVSVIIPTYNSSKFVLQTLQSIKNQTYKNWELLITDDCSTDETVDTINSFIKNDERIKLFKLDNNSGTATARNHSIYHAKGRYIAFCDSDDRWKPNKLEVQIAYMKEHDCGFSYTSYDIINENGKSIGSSVAKPTINYKNILRNNYIGCLTAIYDTNMYGKLYMPKIRKRQDWALWIMILQKSNKACGLNQVLATYMQRKNSISSNKFEMLKYNFNIYFHFLKLSRLKSFFYMIRFVFYFLRYKKLGY